MTTGHFWVVKADGSIYDPDFAEYSFIKRCHDCTDERVYYPVSFHDRPDMLKFIMEDWKKIKDLGMAELYSNPMPYQCNRNAMFYKTKHPDCKIVFGSMGWKTKDGDEWIEFEA